MPRVPYHCTPSASQICDGLERIRDEQEIPDGFDDHVDTEVDDVVGRGPVIPPQSAGRTIADRRNIDFVTIDPPGSMDLDQAYFGYRTPTGWTVNYAIADVAGWVAPEGPIDVETRRRGFTFYGPDGRTPLHPPKLSEAAASLLPDQDRQALLWTIELDDSGNLLGANLERALVRSRAKLSYADAQASIDAGDDPSLNALREIGLRRQALEVGRGAISLQLAQQEVIERDGTFTLEYGTSLAVEGWNAQISLLTGIAAGKIMQESGTGMLRTLPTANGDTIEELRLTAKALELDWPDSVSYQDFVRGLDPAIDEEAAMISQSARGLRGAGYLAFENEVPHDAEHAAIASVYAHVTAPLRRLGDRFVNECILSHCADAPVPEWVLAALPTMPSLLGKARNREGNYDRAIVDLIEAALLSNRVGETFRGLVVASDPSRPRSKVQLRHPAVVAYADGSAELGDEIDIRLVEADVDKRRVTFEAIA